MAINNGLKWSAIAGGAAFVLCLVCMLAGGLTWLTGAAGWLVFFALVFSAVVGFTVFNLINLHNKQDWLADRRDVYDRMQDAQLCIKAEERAHERTKAELSSAKRQITQEHAEAQRYLKQYNEAKDAQEAMRIRCGQRDGVIKELRAEIDELQKANFTEATDNANKLEAIRQQVQQDNDTWRQQVSNMREAAYKLAVHIESSANGLPDEWEAWGAELAQDLRKLAGAGGVQADERQIPIEGTTTVEAEIEAVAGPVTHEQLSEATTAMVIDYRESLRETDKAIKSLETIQGTSAAHPELDRIMRAARANQVERRARLDVICKALEAGYDLSETFKAAASKGAIWVTDDMIRKECELIGKLAEK